MSGLTITGVIFVLAAIASVTAIWRDRRKLRREQQRRREWNYLDQTIDRDAQ